jgi:tape measure domain-containing protein
VAQSYQVDIVTKVVGASSVAKLERSLENLTAEQTKVDRASVKAANGIRTFNNSARAAGAASKGATASVQGLGAAINAAAAKITVIVGAVQTFGRVMSTTFERQAAEQRLKNLTGSTEEYEAALLAAASVSQKFGITQTEATKALGDVYSRLSGVGYGLKEVTTIYQGFNAVARESGVSSEAASAAFLQLGQAMGSGVLQGDELRSILEQMPQLTQLIAQQMGIAAGQVKQFGAEGKITSDVIFAALQKASQGAVDLNGKLTPTQQAMNNFNKAIDSAGVALGTTLVPALTSLLQAITPVIEAVGILGQKLNELGVSKVFEFLMAPARAFGELVNGAAVNTEDLSGKAEEAVNSFSGLPAPIQSAKEKTEQLKEQTNQLAAAQREYQAALGGEQADIDRELQVTQAILNAEKQINDAKLQQANADLQAATNQAEREAAAQRIYDLTISNAQLEYEATIAAANAEMQKVEAALKHATMLEKQIKAEVSLAQSKGIYNDQQQEALDNANALVQEAEKNLQAQDQINQSIEASAAAQLDAKQKAALTAMEANRIKQETDGAVASANNLAAAYDRAAGAANNAAAAANAAAAGGFSGGVGGSGDGTKQWTNAYKPIVTKKLDAEGNIVDKTEKEIEREKNALKLQGWKGGILEVKDGGADTFAAAAFNASWFAAGLTAGDASRQANNLRKYGGMVGPKGSIVDMEYRRMTGEYAEGGYVTGPTNALIGEGGEPEYIIPQSKMDSAMQRYGSGMRGSSVIPDNANVSINYSGSTVDMGGTSYINKGDVNGIVSQAVNATLTTLKKSPKARLEAGMR